MALPSEVTARLGNVIRRLSSDHEGEIIAAMNIILRLLESCGGGIHGLAAQVENGGMSEKYREEVRAQIKKAHEVGYEKGVRAAEARFRPDGKLEFSEVALF